MPERRQVSDVGEATVRIGVLADVKGFGLVPAVFTMKGEAKLELDQPEGLSLESAPSEILVNIGEMVISMSFPDGTSYEVKTDGAAGKVVRTK